MVEFPGNSLEDVPGALRRLADGIEAGEYGGAHNVAWVVDRGGGAIEVGLCGRAGETGPVAHYLLALGMRKIESVSA